jgi:hypothetical protein
MKRKTICSTAKVIHPKYYKHLKEAAQQNHFGQIKNGLVSGSKLSKPEILNNVVI